MCYFISDRCVDLVVKLFFRHWKFYQPWRMHGHIKNPGRKLTIWLHARHAKAMDIVSECMETIPMPVKSLPNWINGFLFAFDGPKMGWIGKTEICCFSFPFRFYKTPQREVNLVTQSAWMYWQSARMIETWRWGGNEGNLMASVVF